MSGFFGNIAPSLLGLGAGFFGVTPVTASKPPLSATLNSQQLGVTQIYGYRQSPVLGSFTDNATGLPVVLGASIINRFFIYNSAIAGGVYFAADDNTLTQGAFKSLVITVGATLFTRTTNSAMFDNSGAFAIWTWPGNPIVTPATAIGIFPVTINF